MDDTDLTLSQIQKYPARLRQHMIDISKHGISRRQPVDSTRFLLIDPSVRKDLSSISESDLKQAHVSVPPPINSYDALLHLGVLRVARRSALKRPSAYAAVSYCWKRDPRGIFEGSNEPIDVLHEDASTKPSTAPFDVLSRSIAYAAANGVNGIWIDQICINQADPIDKENNIQVMDMIYQNSDHPIAVLEFGFRTQAELDVFASICDDGFFTFDPAQIEVLETVLLALSEDQWFERAWTLQESVSAGVSMILLLGCSGLQKPTHFGNTPGELEINIWDFQNAMVSARNLIEGSLTAGTWDDDTSAISASNYADILWNYMPTIIPDYSGGALERDSSHRQKCNAAQALTYLDDRYNSVFSDRLAILANLCNYDYRIDTKVLDLPDSSFTVCAISLAILNGDMSLLGGYVEQPKVQEKAVDARSNGLVYENDDNDLPSNTYGFSWGPKSFACLNSIQYLEEHGNLFRLQPSTLSASGLHVYGVLWEVSCEIPVPGTQAAFASRWQGELALQQYETVMQGQKRQENLVRGFSWHLLQELISDGFSVFAKTVWNFVQPIGQDPILKIRSIAMPLPYSFNDIISYQNLDPNTVEDIRSRLSAPILSIGSDLSPGPFDRPAIERLLIEQVCEKGALLCAVPAKNDNGAPPPQPHVWFEACKVGDKIFTPFTELGDRAARSHYRNQAMSWRV